MMEVRTSAVEKRLLSIKLGSWNVMWLQIRVCFSQIETISIHLAWILRSFQFSRLPFNQSCWEFCFGSLSFQLLRLFLAEYFISHLLRALLMSRLLPKFFKTADTFWILNWYCSSASSINLIRSNLYVPKICTARLHTYGFPLPFTATR